MLIMSCYSVGKLLVLQHLTLQSEIHIGIQIPSSPEMNALVVYWLAYSQVQMIVVSSLNRVKPKTVHL